MYLRPSRGIELAMPQRPKAVAIALVLPLSRVRDHKIIRAIAQNLPDALLLLAAAGVVLICILNWHR